MAVRARTPNRENENDFSPYYRGLGFDQKNQTIKVNASEIPAWSKMNEVEMVIHQHWYQSRVRIESLKMDKDTAVITPMQPAKKNIFQLTYAKMLNPNKPYYFENALEFLDQGGEWYLDKVENMVYYKPRPGEDIQKIEVVYPALETVVSIKGQSNKPVCNLTIKNLQISNSNWILPSRDGIIATQAVQGKGYPGSTETGIVQVEFAKNVVIEHCELIGAGNHGVVFSKGVLNSQIRFCHIDQISANGVVVDNIKKSFPPDSLFCKNDRIADNLIENIGMHYTNGMGLIASCVAGLVVENNEIRFGRYSGMQIGNHYGDNLSGMRDNLIRRNNIHHVMQLHDDGGAIYTLALQPGTRIMQNWMHDFGKSIWSDNFPVNGVFLDNNSGYIRVQDNVFTDLNTVDRIKEQCAGNATTRDNILDNNNTQSAEVKSQSGVRGKAGLTE
ncbi:MAG: right-handed parallel beta-helix repeat-containing protein [Bacteroidales bacterium]|nr:right-handed parallel beta-helix repeat-containing protein [Bacteroidales bacterium]